MIKTEKKQVLAGLHLIRGLCALSVMAYHYLHALNAGTFDAIGTYGVYTFFVLSGFALYYVYGEEPVSEKKLRDFYIARIFRIAPLYIAVASYVLIKKLFATEYLYKYLLNITLGFGLGNPGETSLVVGGWSIGIECVFYLLFPIILLLRSKRSLIVLLVVSLVMNHVLATLSFQNGTQDWGFYTQPLTFLCYFVGGILLAKTGADHNLVNNVQSFWLAPFLILCMLMMFFAPYIAGLSKEDILYGWESKFMILASLSIVALGGMAKIKGIWRSVSIFLGDISYAVYLIHMPVFGVLRSFGLSGASAVALACLFTILAAVLIYRYLESPARALQWRFRGAKT